MKISELKNLVRERSLSERSINKKSKNETKKC